jgi:hypothetical protein
MALIHTAADAGTTGAIGMANRGANVPTIVIGGIGRW